MSFLHLLPPESNQRRVVVEQERDFLGMAIMGRDRDKCPQPVVGALTAALGLYNRRQKWGRVQQWQSGCSIIFTSGSVLSCRAEILAAGEGCIWPRVEAASGLSWCVRLQGLLSLEFEIS